LPNSQKSRKSKHRPRLPFVILYEDLDILVIDKPAGMLSVATNKAEENTAYRAVNQYVKLKNKYHKIWIVHRLDRETSGVMLFAKSEKFKLALQKRWEELALKREYMAVVCGEVKPEFGQVKSFLNQTKSFYVYSSKKEGDGKLAITNYRVLKSNHKRSLVELTLETGRKNQIRVHMSDIGHPIIGDDKYGVCKPNKGITKVGFAELFMPDAGNQSPAPTNSNNQKCKKKQRLHLHASTLEIKHPFTGENMRFESPLPHEFGYSDY